MSKYPYKGFKKDDSYVQENLEYRRKIWDKSNDDIDFQALLMNMSKEDVLFWINTFVYTFDPRIEIPHIPFITFPFQDDFVLKTVECIEKGRDLLVDKSRDMGASWMILAVFVWGWLFHGWEFRVASRNRDYVDKGGDMNSLFEKMRYIMERIPEWMVPYKFENKRGTENNSAAKLINPLFKNTIVGEATSPNFARGGRSKAILYDEFAVWMCADEAWNAGADATNCRIAASTPAGLGNKFADLRHQEDLDIERVSLHWRLHPFKTEEWYLQECERRSPEEVAQELDISYEASASNKVYEAFQKTPIGFSPDYDYDHSLPLFCFWDFGEGGTDMTAMIWAQYNAVNNEVRVIDCYQKNYLDINYFASLATGTMDSQFIYDTDALYGVERRKSWKAAIHIGDPYNGNKTTFVQNTTISKELLKHGIVMNLDRGCNNVMERVRIATLFIPFLKVHDRCRDFINAMLNSRWPKRERISDNTSPLRKPVHNQYSHYRTAFEYGMEFLSGYKMKTKRNRFYSSTTNQRVKTNSFRRH